jgi:hypothetical protein
MQVSVQEQKSTFELRAYPNPVTDKLMVTCSEYVNAYELMDHFGRLIQKGSIANSNTIELNLHHLARGVYQLRVLGNENRFIMVVKE